MKRKTLDVQKESACLVKYAGLQLTTGKQAECYANDFIGLHVKSTAAGRTYSTQGDFITGLKAQLAEAQKAGSPDAGKITDLNTQITTATAARESLFKGRNPPRSVADLLRVQRLRCEGRTGRHRGRSSLPGCWLYFPWPVSSMRSGPLTTRPSPPPNLPAPWERQPSWASERNPR